MKFETSLKRLEEIVARLEGGEVSLEEALELYLEGVKTLRLCEKQLSEAEHRVEILLRGERKPLADVHP